MKVFWDTNLFIYLVERSPKFHSRVLELYRSHANRNERVVTSTLTLGELIAMPMRQARHDLVGQYTELLTKGTLELIDFTTVAARHYAELRSRTSIRQPDAIQISCALAGGATQFFTNDQRLWSLQVPGLEAIRGL